MMRWLNLSPVFEQDAQLAHRARVLVVVLFSSSLFMGISAFGAVPFAPVAAVLVAGVCVLLLWRGRLAPAGLLVLLELVIHPTVVLFLYGLAIIPAGGLYVYFVLAAWLLFERRGLWFSLAAVAVALAGLAVAQVGGLPAASVPHGTSTQWALCLFLLFMTGLLAHLSGMLAKERQGKQRERAALSLGARGLFSILNAVDDVIVVMDTQGRLVAANETFGKMMRKPLEKLVGVDLAGFLPPEVAGERRKNLEVVLQTGKMLRVLEHFGGAWRENSLFPIVDDDGGIGRVLVYSRNVDEQKQYEDALRASEEKYRGLLASLDNVIIAINPDGVLLFVNEYVPQIFGRSEQEMVGKHVHELLPAHISAFIMDYIRRVIKEDKRYVVPFFAEFLSPPRWYDMTLQPVHGADGGVAYVLVNARDIHELKTAQQELLELNATLERRVRERTAEALELYDNAPVGYLSLDAQGCFLQANQTLLGWLGRERDEVMGQSLTRFISPQAVSTFEDQFHLLQQKGMINNFEGELLAKDGSLLTVLVSAVAVYDEQGGFVCDRTTVVDISERKKVTDALGQSEARFRSLFEQMHDAVVMLDLQGRLQLANQRASDMLGYSPEELFGISPEQIGPGKKEFESLLARTASRQGAPVFETFARRKDGSTFPVEINASLIRDRHDHPSHIQFVIRDISAQKQAEEALLAANQALQHAMRMKDEFLANMSHELRTPLTGVLGLSEALQMQTYGPLAEKQVRALANIEQSGRHLLDLINDILDLSKLESGRFVLELEPVGLGQVCRASLQMVKGMAHKKKLRVHFEMEDELLVLHADSRRLKQMLVNLLSNAVKFSREGGAIGLQVHSSVEDQIVALMVWDEGVGIPPEDVGRLFQPFTQLNNSLGREFEGTGLGLALVRDLARYHGGDVSVESEPGVGSRFTITLPWAQAGGQALPATPEVLAGAAGALHVHAVQGVVMVVDDNPLNASYVTDLLISRGFKAVPVPDANAFLQKVGLLNPDVILMDIQLPGMDGLEAIRLLRAHADARVASTPVIALTALAMPGDRERCLQAGADDYLSKPFRFEHLLEKVGAQVGRRAGAV